MPFGPKNAGATYQRLVSKVFDRLIGKIMEVYVDDTIIKSVQDDAHNDYLREMFKILRRYSMNLNPKKRVFGV